MTERLCNVATQAESIERLCPPRAIVYQQLKILPAIVRLSPNLSDTHAKSNTARTENLIQDCVLHRQPWFGAKSS